MLSTTGVSAAGKPRIFFVEPRNGAAVKSPVHLEFGIENYTISDPALAEEVELVRGAYPGFDRQLSTAVLIQHGQPRHRRHRQQHRLH